MSDFLNLMQGFQESFKRRASSALSYFDRLTFGMLVDCLKSDDPTAVKEAIDGLKKERRPQAIAPLYVVAHSHPHPAVRGHAAKALHEIVTSEEIDALCAGKDIKESVQILVEKYGHYKR